jgi:hypothetical protein
MLRRWWLTHARRVTPLEWVLTAIMLTLTYRYFWLMDDAFIYFRYVDNQLFLGRGLVFNAGEYVEGYTSPLWLLLLIPLRALHLDYWPMVRWLGVMFAGVFSAMLIVINARLTPRSVPRVNLPLAFCAGHYGVLSHMSSGLETPLVQLSAAVLALAAVFPSSAVLHVLLALTPLARPELAVPCGIYTLWWIGKHRRLPLTLIAAGAMFNGGWLLFRVYYYADFFPNTFYLKGGAAWQLGLEYFRNVTDAHHLALLAPLFGVAAFALRRKLRPHAWSPRTLLLVCAASVLLWSIRIGGDMLYFRFAVYWHALAVIATGGIAEMAIASAAVTQRALLRMAAPLGLFMFSFCCYPAQLTAHPLTETPSTNIGSIADPMWHRLHPDLVWDPRFDPRQRNSYAQAVAAGRGQTKVMVHGWCRRAYNRFDQYVVQAYGLTDPVLARLAIPASRPGHKSMFGYAQQLGVFHRPLENRLVGAYRRLVDRGNAPRWMVRNLTALEVIERRSYNRHAWGANFALALQPSTPVSPD